jgi:three-Cys-motif partner protein
MANGDDPNYFGREQSRIKHIILEKYLERFAVIIGSWCDGIIYIDGFSGPWNVQSEKLEDASFSIALRQLRQAREVVRRKFKRDFRIKCIFLEKEPRPFARLKEFANEQKDVDVTPLNLEFENAIPELLRTIHAAGRGFFPFIFIDPTGWKGFAMQTIAPLLRVERSEILVNFMTGFIIRFAEDRRDEIGAGFEGLFGDASFRGRLQGLEGRAREDALVFEYAARIGAAGGFPHVPITVVPHPTKDRTHFHLVYATRSIRGLEVFKEAEKKALNMVGEIRADAKRREREARTSQPEFFAGSDAPDVGYVNELASHYDALGRKAVHQLIRQKRELSFDEICASALQLPTVQIASVREWILEIADFENLGPSDRVAKLGCGHRVRFRDGKGQTSEFNFQE